jgi:hypothetical protein
MTSLIGGKKYKHMYNFNFVKLNTSYSYKVFFGSIFVFYNFYFIFKSKFLEVFWGGTWDAPLFHTVLIYDWCPILTGLLMIPSPPR